MSTSAVNNVINIIWFKTNAHQDKNYKAFMFKQLLYFIRLKKKKKHIADYAHENAKHSSHE